MVRIGFFYLNYRKFISRILIVSMVMGQYYHALECLRFPKETSKKKEHENSGIEKNEKPSIKITRIEQITEFCDKIIYLT